MKTEKKCWFCYFVLIAIILICLNSCISQRRCNDKYPTVSSINIKDSTVITHETRYKDTLINTYIEIPMRVERDSVIFTYQNGKIDPVKPLILKGRYSSSETWFANNKLYGQLTESGWINLQVELKMKTDYIKELQKKVSEKQSVKGVKETPKLVKISAWFGLICFVLILAYSANKIFRIIRYQ